MPYNAGDFIGTETVMIPFNAFSSNDPAASITVTDLANTDVVVFKDASLSQRTSSSGIAVDIDVDTHVGMHWITLDLSDNDDAGFYVAGSQYIVGMVGVTADAGTVTAWVGGFTIGKAAAVVTAALVAHNLDHLALTATAAADMTTEVADNTILSRMLANGDTSAFVPSTDGLQAIRDVAPHGSTMVGTDSAVLATTIGSAVGADISADIAAIPTTMVGTDSAALASAWTATRAGYVDELAAANLPTDISNIPTTMRGTDSAALASVVGALADGAAAGEVTTADTLMQYLKQLINILIGTTGIVAFPAEAAPANGVSLAEVIRAIAIDVAGLNGDAMKGTDGANTTVPDAAGTAAIPGDLMGLANDAITAAKFDESTAFPVVATDTGATQIARVGADGDTLETLSDEIATAQTDLDTLTDARGEPAQGAPPASNTTNGKIDQMYKRWRNKQDSDGSTEQYYGDDTSTVDSKRTVSAAAGTVTKAETVSGP